MENRRSPRFSIELPLSITRAGAARIAQSGRTRNISSMGVLFTAEQEPDLGKPIEYVITLPSRDEMRVNIRCMGKVVRCEPQSGAEEDAGRFQVAATLERYEFVRPPQ